MSVDSTALRDRAGRLQTEFWRYAQATRPPENPVYEHDLSFPYGAQLMAARLGYKIFPFTAENIREKVSRTDCPEPSHALITKWWAGEGRSCPIGAALGPSNVTVVEIADVHDMEAFINLARWEEFLGPLPRTRIAKTPKGYQIHMRGLTCAPDDSLGIGLQLKSLYRAVLLPGSNLGEGGAYRWLRVGDLKDAPDWILDRRVSQRENDGASK
jgi:hypothetical protein